MRRSLLLLSIAFSITATAQTWCPPGATWTYTFSNGWTHEGFARFTYVGDTIVGGTNAKRIDQYAEGIAMGVPFFWDLEPFFTVVDDQLVTYWNGSAYDTLYNFAALPGDHWRLIPTINMDAKVNVIDTGLTSIDGHLLKYLIVGNNGVASDTIIERLGALHRFMLPWVDHTLDAAGGPLRCYSDLDIDHLSLGWNYGCDSYLNIAEDLEGIAWLYPNPGTDQFTLQLPPGDHDLKILDQLGRSVMQIDRISDQAVIVTASLPPGIYTVLINDRNGRSSAQWWVKE